MHIYPVREHPKYTFLSNCASLRNLEQCHLLFAPKQTSTHDPDGKVHVHYSHKDLCEIEMYRSDMDDPVVETFYGSRNMNVFDHLITKKS